MSINRLYSNDIVNEEGQYDARFDKVRCHKLLFAKDYGEKGTFTEAYLLDSADPAIQGPNNDEVTYEVGIFEDIVFLRINPFTLKRGNASTGGLTVVLESLPAIYAPLGEPSYFIVSCKNLDGNYVNVKISIFDDGIINIGSFENGGNANSTVEITEAIDIVYLKDVENP